MGSTWNMPPGVTTDMIPGNELLPTCPKCGAEDAMEHRRHRFSSDRGPNVPDADWDECAVCGYTTEPE